MSILHISVEILVFFFCLEIYRRREYGDVPSEYVQVVYYFSSEISFIYFFFLNFSEAICTRSVVKGEKKNRKSCKLFLLTLKFIM